MSWFFVWFFFSYFLSLLIVNLGFLPITSFIQISEDSWLYLIRKRQSCCQELLLFSEWSSGRVCFKVVRMSALYPWDLWIPEGFVQRCPWYSQIPQIAAEKNLPFVCLFFRAICSLITGHSTFRSERIIHCFCADRPKISFSVFRPPSHSYPLVSTCRLRVWSVSESRQVAPPAQKHLQAWSRRLHPLLCPGSPSLLLML